ncbi:hypothetical protein BDA96_05G040300 [Sorghum bicolor]|uniref:Purple acid phosphatase n=2 Tax=Sorghum bicolor TaxID=4558 RepID=A0A921UF69_SORBI|nr:hypothetical protein BDA96_05G040300 [Sorghum bicolor]OQU82888.1 hypothetical protein SORBI_3005G037850 [Sorghum bicolor]
MPMGGRSMALLTILAASVALSVTPVRPAPRETLSSSLLQDADGQTPQQGRWDSFGRLVEPLASARPWMVTTEGNHDVERLPARPGAGALPCLQRAVAHAARRRRAVAGAGAGADSPPSGDNLYYSFDVRGGRRGARPHAGLLRRPRRGQQRVRAGKEDPCGPVYVTVGDGGNREGLAGKFVDPHSRRSRRSGTGRPASGTAGLRCHACVLGVASERQR